MFVMSKGVYMKAYLMNMLNEALISDADADLRGHTMSMSPTHMSFDVAHQTIGAPTQRYNLNNVKLAVKKALGNYDVDVKVVRTA